jgi:hypothetical protein
MRDHAKAVNVGYSGSSNSRGGMLSSLLVVRPWRVVIASGLVAAGLLLSGAARASAATCRTVQTPNVGSGQNSLTAVSVTSSRNAWAVGYGNPVTQGLVTLIEHWNGKAWKVQPSPSPSPKSDNELYGVAATSSRNAWAVGDYNGVTAEGTLIEHWNGKAWKVQPSPNRAGSELRGVAATSSTNAWAVGDYGHGAHSLIEHWNGKAWKIQASPNLAGPRLVGVAATSPRNAWAVGGALIEHWNGKAWKVQPSPSPGSGNNQQLSGVAATSSTNAWAVGFHQNRIPYTSRHPQPDSGPMFTDPKTLLEHWNGKAWKVQPSPSPGGGGITGTLSGVAATSSTNAWVVGAYYYGHGGDIVERWNGKAWKVQPSPGGGGSGELWGVAATSSTDAWAVGDDGRYPGTTSALHCG